MQVVIKQRREKLMNWNFFLLWQGQFISQIGNQVYAVAMVFWITQTLNSASTLGLLLMLSTLPAVLLGPFAGTLADRKSRRSIIIVSDLICGMAVIALAVLAFVVPGETAIVLPAIFIVSLLLSVVSVFFRPAIAAAIPDLVSRENIMAANSISQGTIQVSQFLGYGVGGVLFRLLGAPMLFLTNGLSYLFAAFAESFIEIPQNIPKKSRNWKELLQNFRTDLAEGFTYVWSNRGLRALFFTVSFLNFFLSPIALLLPFYVAKHLQASPDWYGYLIAAVALGALIGTVLAGIVKPAGNRSSQVVVALFLVSLSLGLLGIVQMRFLCLALTFLAGVFSGFVNITVMGILQMKTPSEIRGRVFGLLSTLTTGLIPVAMGLAGIVVDFTNKNVAPILIACAGITAVLSLLVSLNRHFRQFLTVDASLAASATQHVVVVAKSKLDDTDQAPIQQMPTDQPANL